MSTSAQDKKDDEFAQPTYENGLYGNPKSFTNWNGLPGPGAVWNMLRDQNRSNVPSSEKELEETLPVHKPTFNPEAKLEATWIGHATVVVTLEGVTFLTDPIWSDRCSPIFFLGPKRYRPPPCSIEDLPKVDFVVISHNHYDHLDKDTVRKLEERFGGENGKLKWFVPMGLKWWMESVGCHRVQELTWGEHTTITINKKNLDVYCLPAQHWSVRGPFDRWKLDPMKILGSAAIQTPEVFVAPPKRLIMNHEHPKLRISKKFDIRFGRVGRLLDRRVDFTSPVTRDSAKRNLAKIGRKLGPFDLAAIPIGCYDPMFFMSSQHIGPEEAIEIHRLIKSKNSIGVHWGTFHMGSHEPHLEPSQKLKELMKNTGPECGKFKTVYHGKTIDFSTDL